FPVRRGTSRAGTRDSAVRSQTRGNSVFQSIHFVLRSIQSVPTSLGPSSPMILETALLSCFPLLKCLKSRRKRPPTEPGALPKTRAEHQPEWLKPLSKVLSGHRRLPQLPTRRSSDLFPVRRRISRAGTRDSAAMSQTQGNSAFQSIHFVLRSIRFVLSAYWAPVSIPARTVSVIALPPADGLPGTDGP